MLNEEYILKSLGIVSDALVEETGRALYAEHRGKKRSAAAWKALLAAAMIVSLLAVTAYAAGWFGLSSRLTATELKLSDENSFLSGKKLRFSFNDYAGTATAEASREWEKFQWEYFDTHSDFDDGFLNSLAEPERSYCLIYGAFDREMLDKLIEISESYGVRLHTSMYAAPEYEAGLRALGIPDFITGEADRSFKLIFEDGSFVMESFLNYDGELLSFSLTRGAKGVIEDGGIMLSGEEIFDEWEYVTQAGESVNIAVNKWSDITKTVPIIILYDAGDYLVTLRAVCPNAENIRAEAERLAERFDYAALTGGKLDMSALEMPKATARPCKPKAGLMTVKEFFETDEYKASTAFQRAYSDYYSQEVTGLEYRVGAYKDFYFGAFPAEDGKVNEILNRLISEYPGLTVPHEALAVFAGYPIDASRITGAASYLSLDMPSPDCVYEKISMEELFRMTGTEPFLAEGSYTAVAYDNGAFYLASLSHEYAIYYIPKGSFFPALRFAVDENGEAWTTKTACGEQVSIALGGSWQNPVSAFNYALYETDTAYVLVELAESIGAGQIEEILDGIDFTRLNEQKPWGENRKFSPRYLEYAPLTIMNSDWRHSAEVMIFNAETEAQFWTYEALSGKDTEGIIWSLSGSDNVTLTDRGDGSCSLVSHGETREAVELCAKRGNDSFTIVVVCCNNRSS